MGESKLKRLHAERMFLPCAGVQTAGGRVRVRWEADSAATPMGQLAYFIEFLTLTGLWSGWQERCPLSVLHQSERAEQGRGAGDVAAVDSVGGTGAIRT